MEQNKLLNGLQTAFINQEIESDPYWRPKFVYNDYLNGKKVLSDINGELETCDEFIFSVAFITDAGLEPLLMTLKELEKRNIKGKILTTNYLHFTNPSAIKKLNSLNNIELKMYFVDNESSVGFHTKGYIFKHGDNFHIITGSSNLTKNAISKNEEWNTKIVCNKYGEYAQEILEEFSHLWNSDKALKLSNSLLDKYTIDFNKRSFIRNKYEYEYGEIIDKKIVANKMQKEFVNNIKLMISEGKKRALLISATGTGKTYASAFAIEQIKPKKVLFLVHREQIIDQAIISYKRILGDKITMGKVTGGNKNFKEDITFATVQTLSKDYNLKQLSKSAFDFIIIDEVHRAGADSYQKIMNYFTPNFYLGMSASPERTDKFNIYKLFDYNIACEIRLQQALEEDFLCPFHYFGITDILIDGETVDDLTELRNFNLLVSDERVKHIISSAEYYGYSGNRVKGLVFCRSRKEGKELSLKMNKCINNNNGKFYSTIFLSGENSQEERERAIERLTEDNRSDTLDYIFTVDIFNEGVDIPQINQVILLRPTQSPVVFIQQLGRGLRKFDNKDFVVVLDFIGNYTNNFMIPIALSGNRTNNKDDIRRYVQEGERIIPGESTIHFDYISRQNIFSSIDRASFNSISYLKEKYFALKNKLGRSVTLLDFDKYSEMDPVEIFNNSRLGSYYTFLKKCEKNFNLNFSTKKENYLKYLSTNFGSGKRIDELIYLDNIIKNHDSSIDNLRKRLKKEYNITLNQLGIASLKNLMTNKFESTKQAINKYKEVEFISETGNTIKVSSDFKEMLKDQAFYEMFKETLDFAINRYNQRYRNLYKDSNFTLYEKYTYRDVCRLLNWEKNQVALNIGGYKYDEKTKTYPVFINYKKDDSIVDTQKYEDKFLSMNTLVAISKSGRTLSSPDVDIALHAKENNVKMDLFVRKNKDDKISKEFYYLGRISATGQAEEFRMENTNSTAVKITYKLQTPVREDLYHYFVD